jgi:hypothetical protein
MADRTDDPFASVFGPAPPISTGGDRPDPFAAVLPLPPSTPAEPPVGYGEDIGKGVVGGLGRGVAGTLGIGGTVGGLIRSGLSYAGVPEDYLNKGAAIVRGVGNVVPQARALTGPSGADLQAEAEKVTGKFYEPRTVPGQYASTIAEFAPGAILGGEGVLPKVFNTVVPALTSETAGQFTKGTAWEPWARFIGGIAAAPAGKLVTPAAPASAVRQAAVATLEDAGIPVTAGQRTGSRPIQWLESSAADTPGSAGRAQALQAAQRQAYDRAITGGAFDPNALAARGVGDTHLPDPAVFTAGRQSLRDEYTRLTQNVFKSDPQLHSDLTAARQHYEGNTLPSQRGTGSRDLNTLHNELIDKLVAGQGTMPGGQYQAIRSRFGKLADSTTDTYLAEALQKSQKALDDAMQRGLSPADAAAWRLNNQRYAIMKTLAPQVAKSTENLSPQGVAQALRTGRADQYAAQTGALDRLSSAADMVLKPMPNSGTSARLGWQQLFSIPAMIAGGGAGYMGGGLFGALGGTAAAAAPFVVPRVALSRAGQAYLGNRLMPNNTRDAIAAILAQQAISQRGNSQ